MQGLPLQECMRRNTSSEFMDWKHYLETKQAEATKQDYYLAQIALEIRRILEGFSKSPRALSIEDFLLFGEGSGKRSQSQTRPPVPATEGRKPIEVGPDAIKDPKWAAVNTNAKATWGFRLNNTTQRAQDG